MDEFVPVLLAFLSGAAIGALRRPAFRLLASVLAIGLCAAAATIASGEYQQSWSYLLLDGGEAALGLAAGLFAAHRFAAWARGRSMRDRAELRSRD